MKGKKKTPRFEESYNSGSRQKPKAKTDNRERTRSSASLGDGILGQLGLRGLALLALAGIMILGLWELESLRGALAYARFDMNRRAAGKARSAEQHTWMARAASSEVDLMLACGQVQPEFLWEVSGVCRNWAGNEKTNDVRLRLQLAEKAVRVAAAAVDGAPSDYTNWVQLARALALLGLKPQAETSLARARELTPAWKNLEAPGLEVRAPPPDPAR
ncbi:unnamed protein product [marine sediment metagenome]|uniref:Tetratricopeptide repeat-like domain-containing protein n=1 Tax=marine sediment metagenome TaxID=412755 RepID=X0TXX0_9ZZZZ